jgi:hypothetical protein
MKPITILLLSAISLKTHAQWAIMPSVSYAKTSLYNKEERLADRPLQAQQTFATQYGITAYRVLFSKQNLMHSLLVGLSSQTYRQKYDGLNVTNQKGPASASRSLSYLSMPILYELQFAKLHTIKPFVHVGFRLELLHNYNISYKASYFSNPVEDNWLYSVTQNNINLSIKSPSEIQADKYTLSSSNWFYKRLNVCSTINVGTSYALNSKCNVRAQLDCSFGLMDVERKKVMQFTNTAGISDGLIINFSTKSSYDPWYRYANFISQRAPNDLRPATYTRSIGGTLALAYTL